MSFEEEKEGQRRRKDSMAAIPPAPPAKKRRAPAKEVGEALKSVYQRTVDEQIPPEMLDLLGKLG